MEYKDKSALEETMQHLEEAVDAMELMVLGLAQAKDPYKNGINSICVQLRESVNAMKELLF